MFCIIPHRRIWWPWKELENVAEYCLYIYDEYKHISEMALYRLLMPIVLTINHRLKVIKSYVGILVTNCINFNDLGWYRRHQFSWASISLEHWRWGSQVECRRREIRGAVSGKGVGSRGGCAPSQKIYEFFISKWCVWCILGVLFLRFMCPMDCSCMINIIEVPVCAKRTIQPGKSMSPQTS